MSIWAYFQYEGGSKMPENVLTYYMDVPLAHLGDECPACQSGVRAHLLRQAQFKQSESFRAKRYAHLPIY